MTDRSSETDDLPGRPTTAAQGYYDASLQHPAVYVLERAHDEQGQDKPGSYLLKEQISYVSADGRAWTVPAEAGDVFSTDLASIPTLASWLVPKDGSHTPAALIHDAMVLKEGEQPCYGPGSPVVQREQADRLFREGMQYLGVRLVRRWLMWTAVSIPTLFERGGLHWLRRLLLVGLAFFIALGLFGVPDVFDVPGAITLPTWVPVFHGDVISWQFHWIDEDPSFLREAGSFLEVTAIGGAVYAALWLKRWRFGLTAGLALSLLAFALAIPGLVFVIYMALEEAIAFVLIVRKQHVAEAPPTLGPEAEPVADPVGRVRSSEWVERLAERF